MPCVDCQYWRRGKGIQFSGQCLLDQRTVHSSFHCARWELRPVMHADVGMTPAEVFWARSHAANPDIAALRELFQRIQRRPQDASLREQFTARLEKWRKNRVRQGVVLPHPPSS